MSAQRTCSKCGSKFDPTSRQSICLPCDRIIRQAYRDRRRAEGRPIKGSKIKPEKRKAYREVYEKSPERRAVLRARWHKRFRDPIERPKYDARWTTQRAIKLGRITKQPCEICGEPKTDAHHDDYTKPLEVRWLCRPHHVQLHKASGDTALAKAPAPQLDPPGLVSP